MPGNLFADIPDCLSEELIEILLSSNGIRIERIISDGQITPEGEWYDQSENEWVVVLEGSARLLIDSGESTDRSAESLQEVTLDRGDQLFLPAHQRHRVIETSRDPKTIWLAVFFTED